MMSSIESGNKSFPCQNFESNNEMDLDGVNLITVNEQVNVLITPETKITSDNLLDSTLRLSHGENGYINHIDKIIHSPIQVEANEANEANETSTCPSKFKNKLEGVERSSSSSKSSYHNRKKKSKRSKRSKSKDKRKQHSKKERKHRRSRSRNRDRRGKSKSRSRSDSKKRHSRRHHRRDSVASSSSDSTIKKKNYFEERRKGRNRERSNSALRVMKLKNLENACGYYQRYYQRPHEDNDPTKPQLHWDGYQWVIRPTTISDSSFDIIKPGRKVQIANVPLHLNIQVHLFKDYLMSKIIENSIVSNKDVKDINNIIKGIELDYENNTAVIAMESTEVAKRMVLLDGLILLGHTLRFSPYQDVNNADNASNIVKAAALANSAHLSAKSAAIAFAALKSLGNKNEAVQINLQGDVQSTLPSHKVVKLMNLVDPKESSKIKGERLEEILDDMKEEFAKFGSIVSSVIIKPKNEKIGAEFGSVFIEYQEIKSAENAIKGMKGKRYEGRELKIAFIDDIVFKKEIL